MLNCLFYINSIQTVKKNYKQIYTDISDNLNFKRWFEEISNDKTSDISDDKTDAVYPLFYPVNEQITSSSEKHVQNVSTVLPKLQKAVETTLIKLEEKAPIQVNLFQTPRFSLQ